MKKFVGPFLSGRFVIPFFLLPFLLGTGLAQDQIQGSILEMGKWEVEPGYSSTYLPLEKGLLANRRYKAAPESHTVPEGVSPAVLKVDLGEKSLQDRWDEARKQILGRTDEEFLAPFFTYYDYDPEEDPWRGMCHQFTSANCDPLIKSRTALPTPQKPQNLICGSVLLENTDLRELVTATYPSKNDLFLGSARNAPNEHYNEAFFNKKNLDFIEAHGGLAAFKEINEVDHKMIDSLGLVTLPAGKSLQERWILPAHTFHQHMIEGLQKGRGVALNIDPNEEIWNQAAFSMESSNETIPGNSASLPYFRYGSDDAAASNHFFYESSSPEGKSTLDKMDQVDGLLKTLVSKRDKVPDQKVTVVLKSDLAALDLSSDLKDFLEKEESSGKTPAKVMESLMALKENLFHQGVEKKDFRLKDQFLMEKITSKVQFMDEHEDFRVAGNKIGKVTYEYLVVKNKNNGFVYSQWVGPHKKGFRPGFLWYPSLQVEACHKKANDPQFQERFKTILKNKEYIWDLQAADQEKERGRWNEAVDVCLNVGLSDLMKICDSCVSLEEAYEEAGKLIRDVKELNSSLGPLSAIERLKQGIQELRQKNIEVDELELEKQSVQ